MSEAMAKQAKQLRPVGLDFLDSAPRRLVFARHLDAPPEAVFAALADAATWPLWYGVVTRARPLGDGQHRVIRLRGGTLAVERILEWAEPVRYAYRVERINVPGLHAMLEDWRLTPSGSGTEVRYTMAADGIAPCLLALRLLSPALRGFFGAAMRALEERLAAAP